MPPTLRFSDLTVPRRKPQPKSAHKKGARNRGEPSPESVARSGARPGRRSTRGSAEGPAQAGPKRKGPLTLPERSKSREETPKEGSGTATSNAALHQYASAATLHQGPDRRIVWAAPAQLKPFVCSLLFVDCLFDARLHHCDACRSPKRGANLRCRLLRLAFPGPRLPVRLSRPCRGHLFPWQRRSRALCWPRAFSAPTAATPRQLLARVPRHAHRLDSAEPS